MRKYKRKWYRTKNHRRFPFNKSINGSTKKLSADAKDIYVKYDCACVNCIDYYTRERIFKLRINTKECLVDEAAIKINATHCQRAIEEPIDSDCDSLIELFTKLYITEPTNENVSSTDQKPTEENVSSTDQKPAEEVQKIMYNKASEGVNVLKMTNSNENYESADSNGEKSADLNDKNDLRARLKQSSRFEKKQSAPQSIADLDDGYKTMSESVTSESIVGYCNWYAWEGYEWNENFVLLDKSTHNNYGSWDQLAHGTIEKSADMFAFRDFGKYEEYCVRSVAAEHTENIEFKRVLKAQEAQTDDNLDKIFDSLINISSEESSISCVEDNTLHISISDEFADEQYQGDISATSPDDFREAQTFETVKTFKGYDGCGEHYHWKYKGYAPLNGSNSSSTDSDNYDTPQGNEKCACLVNKFSFIFDRTERLNRICYDTEYCKYDSIRTLNDWSDRDVQCEMDYSVGLMKRRRWNKSGAKSKCNNVLRGKPHRRGAAMSRKWSDKVVLKPDEIPLLQEIIFDESFATCGRSTSF